MGKRDIGLFGLDLREVIRGGRGTHLDVKVLDEIARVCTRKNLVHTSSNWDSCSSSCVYFLIAEA